MLAFQIGDYVEAAVTAEMQRAVVGRDNIVRTEPKPALLRQAAEEKPSAEPTNPRPKEILHLHPIDAVFAANKVPTAATFVDEIEDEVLRARV